jgi:clan AA aspartic protease (TIGR02281 family)
MFRKTVSAVLGATMLAGFALVAAPAGAASRAWETTSRGWEIGVHSDATCSAYRKYEDGVSFMLGWRRQDKSFWVGFGRDSWGNGGVKAGATYDVSFVTDGKHWNGGEFRGHNEDGKHGALLSTGTLTWPFVEALAKANTVRFLINGKSVLALQLDGSYEALVKTMECQKAQDSRTSAVQPRPAPAAPFSTAVVPEPAPSPAVANSKDTSWTVALQSDGNSIRVEGMLNDTVPVQFIFDTGATGVSITRAMASQIGAKVIRHTTAVYADGRRSTEPVVVIPRSTIGSVTVTSLEATLSDGDPLLGKNFLDAFSSYEVDNRQARLILKR